MTQQKLTTHNFNVFLMNVQSLTHHVADLTSCTQHLQLNCIVVTETRLSAIPSAQTINVDGFSFHSCPWSLSYSSSNTALIALQGQQHGGVGMYTADNLTYNCVTYNILIAVIYHPPSYPLFLFKAHLNRPLDLLDPISDTIAVMGDFNDDIFQVSTICNFMTDKRVCISCLATNYWKRPCVQHIMMWKQ